MAIYIFRHGDSLYKQGEAVFGSGNDLTPEGENIVYDSVRHLVLNSVPLIESPVKAHYSPIGRCVHTMQNIVETLKDNGIKIADIVENKELDEVRNFEWNLFIPLVTGGNFTYGGKGFMINPKLTNPNNLSPVRYFRSDSAHNLSPEAIGHLPAEYVDRIKKFEKYTALSKRFNPTIHKMANEPGLVHIVSTHEALTAELIRKLTGIDNSYLNRGKYFEISCDNGEFTPKLTQKDSISQG